MSQTDFSTLQPHTGGPMITSEVLVDTVKRDIKVNGLDEAIRNFKPVRGYFAAIPGWAEMVQMVDDLFIEERIRLEMEKSKQVVVDQSRHITMKGNNAKYTEH